MMQQRNRLLLAALAAASVGLSQTALAGEAAPAEAPVASVPAVPSPADEARARMEQRFAAAMAERNRRYEALRARANELGFEMPEMPEMPAWEAPPMPPLPEHHPSRMTPEERMARREQRWEELRARAAEQGIEWPETPPWKAAEERRQAMRERFEQYRATLDQLSAEQKEAIDALFGPLPEWSADAPAMPWRGGPPRHWHGHAPCPHQAPHRHGAGCGGYGYPEPPTWGPMMPPVPAEPAAAESAN